MASLNNSKSGNASATQQPIQQYINLLKSPGDISYIRTIVLKALSDPSVFAGFSELRSLPSVQKLETSSTVTSKSLINTLDLFSYGTFNDFSTAEEGTYLNLNKTQLLKLKALSVVSVIHHHCEHNGKEVTSNLPAGSRRSRRRSHQEEEKAPPLSYSCNAVPYSVLQSELRLSTNLTTEQDTHSRELEDLLMHCIYSNLLPSGTKICQKNMCLLLKLSSKSSSSQDTTQTLCRDVNVEKDLSEMIQKLDNFYQDGKLAKAKLQKSVDDLQTNVKIEADEWKKVHEEITQAQIQIHCREGEKAGSSMEWIKGAWGMSMRHKRSRGTNLLKFGKRSSD